MIHIAICEDDITYLCELEKLSKKIKIFHVVGTTFFVSSPEEKIQII